MGTVPPPPPRFSPGDSESCYPVLREDPQIRSAIAKVSAHLETNARQCQVAVM